MASSSILLLPLERLSPSGSFGVRDELSLPRYSHPYRQWRTGTHRSPSFQRLTISTMYRKSLVPGGLSSKTVEGIYTSARNGDRNQSLSIVCYSRGRGGAGHERAKLGNVTNQMRLLLESDGLLATEAATSLVNSMTPEGRSALISALFPGKQHANFILGLYRIVCYELKSFRG